MKRLFLCGLRWISNFNIQSALFVKKSVTLVTKFSNFEKWLYVTFFINSPMANKATFRVVSHILWVSRNSPYFTNYEIFHKVLAAVHFLYENKTNPGFSLENITSSSSFDGKKMQFPRSIFNISQRFWWKHVLLITSFWIKKEF